MSAIRSNFLRAVLSIDAAACGAAGALFAFGGPAAASALGLSLGLMQPVGLFLLAYAAGLVALALRPAAPRGLVWGLVAFNVVWAVESAMVVALGWAQPTALGLTVVLGQAVGALVVADLQFLALRRARAAA